MPSHLKTKDSLIAEIKKLQRKIRALSQNHSPAKNPTKPKKGWWTLDLRHSSNIVAVVNRQLDIIDINKKSQKKVIGLKAYAHCDKASQIIVKKALQQVFKTAQSREYTVRGNLPTGEIIHASCIAFPILENKKVAYAIVEAKDITGEVEAMESLKQNEEKFKRLSDAAFEGIVVHQYGKVALVNKALCEIFKYSENELLGQPILKFIHKDFHAVALEKLKNKVEKPYEMIMLRKGNQPFWAKLMAREIIHKGAQARVVAIRDISANKEAEKKIKESEERFRILANATFEGIVFSVNGKIVDANDQFLKMYGYKSLKELIGKDIITDFVIPKQQAEARKLVRLAKAELFEVQTYRKDKSIITVQSKGQNIPYFGRNIRATVVYNISERKQFEEQLRESERMLSTLMNNLPGMAYRCDYDSKWTMRFISKGFSQLTGYSPKDFIDNKKHAFSDIIHPKDRHIGVDKIRKAIKTKTPFEIEYRIITKNREEKWVWEKGEGVFSEKGKLLFLEGFIADINEKKQYELELSRSRENYKSLIDYSPDGVIIHTDGKIKFANPSALKITGVDSFEELDGIQVMKYILPEYHELMREQLKKVNAGKQLDFVELKIKNLKGELKELETKPIPIKYNGMDAIQVVFHDLTAKQQLFKEQLRSQIAEENNQKLQREISERKNAERILRAAQKYTRLLIDSSLDVIGATNKNGYITEFNKAGQRIYGYALQEVIGKHISMLYANPSDRDIIEREIISKGAFTGELKHRKKNGEIFDIYLSVSVLLDEKGERMGAIGIAHDISEQKKVDEQMRTQSAKLNAIIENSSHIIWTTDRNHCLTSFNHNFRSLIKAIYSTDIYVGMSMVKGKTLPNSEYKDVWIQKHNNVLSGVPQYFEMQLNPISKHPVWCEIFLNPIFDEKGEVKEISGIGLDITEKKEANEKLRQSLQEKDVLLKEVHHRVKNNLQVISSILNLQSSYVKDQQTLNILKESQNRIKSMAFIHESLYQTRDLSSINFSEYITSLTHNLVHSYSNLNHVVKLSLDIQLIFLNLDLAIPCGLIINEIVSNSLKHAFSAHSVSPEITIKMNSKGDTITLIIGDNGTGIPGNINFRNTGSLGLQLVVTLVDQINGDIDLNTKKGTTYTIKFKQT